MSTSSLTWLFEQILLPAPRNSIEGMLNLFDATNCQCLLRAASTKVEHIQSRTNIKVLAVPELDELLSGDGEAVPSYPYHKTFDQAEFDPVIVLHTSGTTGLPKPIELKHGGLLTVDAHQAMERFEGYEDQQTALRNYKKTFCAFPPFHVRSQIHLLLHIGCLSCPRCGSTIEDNLLILSLTGCWHWGSTADATLLRDVFDSSPG